MNPLSPAPACLIAIQRWLTVCIALVVVMVALGGVTRLTESGLSIVEWKLVSGTLPPLSQAAWEKEFSDYKTSPQFTKVNADFTLGDFKQIFWLEYLHRLLGRVIGMVIFLGTAWFFLKRQLPRALSIRMGLICLLVAAQGTVGWIMVASGLVDTPRVAPVKLAAHLLLGFSLYLSLLWTRWQVLDHPRLPQRKSAGLSARGLLGLVALQLVLGALVAGLRAGHSYNSFPLMDGQWIPGGLHLLEPWWRNHLENITTVQFQHRAGAYSVALAIISFVVWQWKNERLRTLLRLLAFAVFLQFGLGVATLLTYVNTLIASLHQLIALWLTGLIARLIYLLPLGNKGEFACDSTKT